MDLLDPFWPEPDEERGRDDLLSASMVWSAIVSVAVVASLLFIP